jgi:uncharacterized integral membrane protein
MVILGIIVLALAVAAVIVLIGANTGDVDVHALGGTWTVQVYWLVVLGVALTAAAMVGILLIVIGAARARKHRNQRRELERENKRMASQIGGVQQTVGASSGPAVRKVDGETHHVTPAEPAVDPGYQAGYAPPAGSGGYAPTDAPR